MENSIFKELLTVDVTDHLEKRKAGNKDLNYLSWVYAWAEIKKRYPDATYEIWKNEKGLPYAYDENTGYIVFVTLIIKEQKFPCFLPVLDENNKAMKSEPYTYTIYYPNGSFEEKRVEAATMFDINRSIMRCLVKACAFAGLGLYVFAGEDIKDFAPCKEIIKEKKINEEKKIKVKIENHHDYTLNKILSVGLSLQRVMSNERFKDKDFDSLSEDELIQIDKMCDNFSHKNQKF